MPLRTLITLPPRTAVRWIALFAALLVVGAYTLEYGFGIKPCALCWLQRYAHWTLLSMALLVMLLPRVDPRRGLKLLMGVAVAGIGLAMYHSLVEAHVLIAGCSKATGTLATTSSDLVAQLADSPVPACDKPHHILWLSLPQWNVLAQGLVVVFGMFTLHQDAKKPRQRRTRTK